MANIFNIGVSGLTSFQTRLATTGHNIANVNTEGYSRQSVGLEALPSQNTVVGAVGSGVTIASISRNYDQFLANRLRDSLSSYEESTYMYSRAIQVDNVIADPAAGMSEVLGDFYQAVNDVADDPTSIPARDVMLSQAEVLVSRFHSMDSYFSELRNQANADMANFAGEMNQLMDGIAELNGKIQSAGIGNGLNAPNDLLDQRDRLIDELNKYVNVTTVSQSDGTMNVFTGNGQTLVLGGDASRLSVQNSPLSADQRSLYLQTRNGARVEINDLLGGGRMGGLLRFQAEVLDPAQDALGLVGVGLAGFFNAEHNTGMDLDGDLGTDFFSMPAPQLLGHSGNTGTASASFSDLSQVQPEEYDLRFDGAAWTLVRRSDKQTIPMGGDGTTATPFTVDGLEVVIGDGTVANQGAAAGDHYLLRPTRGGAAQIGLLVSDPRDIAAADPVATSATPTNTGTGDISAGYLDPRTGSTKLAAPVTLTYNAALLRYDISSGGSIAYDPATDSGLNTAVTIAGLGDFNFQLTGNPADGDSFTLSDNSGGVGDNRNARSLADLQTLNVLFGGGSSITDAYATAVAEVGTGTSRVKSSQEVQKQLLDQAQAAKDAVSGVNLDEEAANLVQFQQAYQASAQVIAAANNMIDTLLGIVR